MFWFFFYFFLFVHFFFKPFSYSTVILFVNFNLVLLINYLNFDVIFNCLCKFWCYHQLIVHVIFKNYIVHILLLFLKMCTCKSLLSYRVGTLWISCSTVTINFFLSWVLSKSLKWQGQVLQQWSTEPTELTNIWDCLLNYAGKDRAHLYFMFCWFTECSGICFCSFDSIIWKQDVSPFDERDGWKIMTFNISGRIT